VSELTLAGFARELSGNEDALTMADPVLEMDGAFFLAPSPNWTWSSLSPLFPGEQEYVRWVRRQDRTPIREGQVVWLAGRELFASVGDMTFLRDFALELGSARWSLYGPGFRWRIGTLGDLDDLKRSIGARLRTKLYELLGDPLEKSHGDADRVFRLYLRLDAEESRDRFLAVALYYFETHNREAVELTRFRAVRSTLFPSEAEFDLSLADLRDWVKAQRLSDAAGSRPVDTRFASHWSSMFDLAEYSAHGEGLLESTSEVLSQLLRAIRPAKYSPAASPWGEL